MSGTGGMGGIGVTGVTGAKGVTGVTGGVSGSTSAAAELQFAPSTPQAALARLAAVCPAAYARTRNHLQGAVTGLSPYLTHGLLSLPQVLGHLGQHHGLDAGHKLVFELGWRAYFAHVWRFEGQRIFESLHAALLPDSAYARELPADIRQAATGLPVIDQAVRCLYRTGTLHNHARMWLASYVVHLRKVHWRAGADWMYGHLLDGDLASNHLSWQWVAATGSHKPYLFNASNVARYAPEEWHCAGSSIDCSYEELLRVATAPAVVLKEIGAGSGAGPQAIAEPQLLTQPSADLMPALQMHAPDPAAVRGQDIWLVHPWCLYDPPAGCLPVAVLDAEFFARWPWSAARWQFVLSRMQNLGHHCWWGPSDALLQALQAARSVRGIFNQHLGQGFAASAQSLSLAAEDSGFKEPAARSRSFSAYWAQVNQHPIHALLARVPPSQQELFR